MNGDYRPQGRSCLLRITCTALVAAASVAVVLLLARISGRTLELETQRQLSLENTVVGVAQTAMPDQSLPQSSNPPSTMAPVSTQLAPDFTLSDLNGHLTTLSSFRGRPVLINFWATWCGPCRLEMPELERAYQASQGQGLVILAINVTNTDSIENVRTFVDDFEFSFPILLDETGNVSSRLYGVLGLPATYFINADSVVTHVHLGAMSGNELRDYLTSAF